VPEGAPEYVTGYRDLCLTGSGTSSVVYRAVQDAYDRVVALKVLTAGADETAQQRFLQEVRLTARLTGHPHVVTVLDTGMTWSGRPYLATEFLGGDARGPAAPRRRPVAGGDGPYRREDRRGAGRRTRGRDHASRRQAEQYPDISVR